MINFNLPDWQEEAPAPPKPIAYKPLASSFTRSGFSFEQLKREGDIAIYHRTFSGKPNGPEWFEVILVDRHNGYELGGNHIDPAECYPGAYAWGLKGWTLLSREAAEGRFCELVGKENRL